MLGRSKRVWQGALCVGVALTACGKQRANGHGVGGEAGEAADVGGTGALGGGSGAGYSSGGTPRTSAGEAGARAGETGAGEAGAGDAGAGEGGGASDAGGVGGDGGASHMGPSCEDSPSVCGSGADADCCATDPVPQGTAGAATIVFPFVLDRYEVTVGRYRKFVAAFGAGFRPAKGSGKDRNNPQDQGWNFELGESVLPRADAFATWTDSVGANESRPVNQLPWLSAFAFCIWDRGRLPTQEEWLEAAGGGEQHRYYPWSNPPTDKTVDSAHASYDCTADGSAQGACSSADLSIVGSHPLGNGRFGHADLGGNVWEWVREPGKPADVARACGGAFFDIADLVRVQCMSGPPNMGQGVRCAR